MAFVQFPAQFTLDEKRERLLAEFRTYSDKELLGLSQLDKLGRKQRRSSGFRGSPAKCQAWAHAAQVVLEERKLGKGT